MSAKKPSQAFRVFWTGVYPKPKREFHRGEFEKRQQARQWCRNHRWLDGLTIEHPDGTLERYEP